MYNNFVGAQKPFLPYMSLPITKLSNYLVIWPLVIFTTNQIRNCTWVSFAVVLGVISPDNYWVLGIDKPIQGSVHTTMSDKQCVMPFPCFMLRYFLEVTWSVGRNSTIPPHSIKTTISWFVVLFRPFLWLCFSRDFFCMTQ